MTRWIYPNSEIIRVVDADTFDILLDHGCKIFSKQRVRLHNVDAYESYGENKSKLGKEAKQYCIDLLQGKKFEIISISREGKRGKYGRLIVDVKLYSDYLLSTNLVELGYAVYKEY